MLVVARRPAIASLDAVRACPREMVSPVGCRPGPASWRRRPPGARRARARQLATAATGAISAASAAIRRAVSPRDEAAPSPGGLQGLSAGRRALLLCGLLSWAFCGAANEPIGLFIPQLVAEFENLAPQQTALVSSGYTVGTVVSTLVAGSLADSRGRRAICRLAGGAAVVATALVTFAPTFPTLVAARALLGLCAGTLMVVIPALVVEGMPAENLDAYLAGFPVGWPLGALMCSAFAGAPWRQATGCAQMLVLVPLLALLAWLPESPQFLLGKGRRGEAALAASRLSGDASVPEAAPSDVLQEQKVEEGCRQISEEQKRPGVMKLFVALSVSFLLCGAASQAVKVWLPVWLAGAASEGSLSSFRYMYGIESVGIVATAALVGARAGKGADGSGGGGNLLSVARGNLLLAAAATLGCLLCRGRFASAGGLLGGVHLIAQANASTLMRACGARGLPVRGRAKKLSALALLYASGCCVGPVLLGGMVSQQGSAFAGIQWTLLGASVLYVAAALYRPF